MPDPVYATPFDMWQIALPPATLFQDSDIEPGIWTDVSKVGVGTGNMDVNLQSNPRSDFSVIVECVSGGELNLYDFLNPGPFPYFRISLDGGVIYSHPMQANANGQLAYQKGGFTLNFSNGVAPPSFVALDRYTFSTTPSPDILYALEAASRIMDSYLADTYCLPLTSWGQDVKLVCCQLARWILIERRGLDKGQDFEVYYPKFAYDWLDKVGKGLIQPRVKPNGSEFTFPMWSTPRPPFKTTWRF